MNIGKFRNFVILSEAKNLLFLSEKADSSA